MLFNAEVRAIEQGEKVVGNATVQLTTDTTPCQGVMIAAPSASNAVGEANTGNILIGFASSNNDAGGFTLANTNTVGILIPVSNPSLIYLTGFNAGDVVEYQILR